MGSILEFRAAVGERHRQSAIDSIERIGHGAQSVLDLVGESPPETNRREIYALAALMAHAASQASLLCDNEDRVGTQHLNRLCELLREHAHTPDPLRIQALAVGIQLLAHRLARNLR